MDYAQAKILAICTLIGIAIIIYLGAFIYHVVKFIKKKRIENFFLSNGYKRKVFDVFSNTSDVFYGWVREYDDKRVHDKDIKGLSVRKIKKKYK